MKNNQSAEILLTTLDLINAVIEDLKQKEILRYSNEQKSNILDFSELQHYSTMSTFSLTQKSINDKIVSIIKQGLED